MDRNPYEPPRDEIRPPDKPRLSDRWIVWVVAPLFLAVVLFEIFGATVRRWAEAIQGWLGW